MKKAVILGISILFIFLSFTPQISSTNAINSSKTLYVGGSGPGNYTTIQSAIDDANPGDTVFVFDDSAPYHERLVLNKSLTLMGENRDTTILDPDNDVGIHITADNCVVSGFRIIDCIDGVLIEGCDGALISNNNISTEIEEIQLSSGREKDDYIPFRVCVRLYNSDNNEIRDNDLGDTEHYWVSEGVHLHGTSSNNVISDNNIFDYANGISDWLCNGSGNTISGNYIHNNGLGLDLWSGDTKIIGNEISYNLGNGIVIMKGQDYIISGNKISYNGWEMKTECDGGILIKRLYPTITNNVVSNNEISYNVPTGLYISGSSLGNTITKNNFIDNGLGGDEKYWGNAYFFMDDLNFKTRNKWSRNYWSDYDGSTFFYLVPGDAYLFGIFPMNYAIGCSQQKSHMTLKYNLGTGETFFF